MKPDEVRPMTQVELLTANKPNLKYKFVKSKSDDRGNFNIKAEPSEWGCHITGEVRREWTTGNLAVEVSWSAGSFSHNTADAREFFKAGLRLCKKMESALSKQVPK